MVLNSERLTQARLDRSLTRPQLSRLTGLSVETIKRSERGTNIPSAEALAKIASALGVSMDSLFDPEPEKEAVA